MWTLLETTANARVTLHGLFETEDAAIKALDLASDNIGEAIMHSKTQFCYELLDKSVTKVRVANIAQTMEGLW